jgi:hypothetical protein
MFRQCLVSTTYCRPSLPYRSPSRKPTDSYRAQSCPAKIAQYKTLRRSPYVLEPVFGNPVRQFRSPTPAVSFTKREREVTSGKPILVSDGSVGCAQAVPWEILSGGSLGNVIRRRGIIVERAVPNRFYPRHRRCCRARIFRDLGSRSRCTPRGCHGLSVVARSRCRSGFPRTC